MSYGDPWERFTDALPEHLAAQLDRTPTAVDALVAAMGRGWTVDQLVAECTRAMAQANSPAGLTITRLAGAARKPPPGSTAERQRWTQPNGPCGRCDGTAARWLETAAGAVIHCPTCWTPPPGYTPPERLPTYPPDGQRAHLPAWVRADIHRAIARRKDPLA